VHQVHPDSGSRLFSSATNLRELPGDHTEGGRADDVDTDLPQPAVATLDEDHKSTILNLAAFTARPAAELAVFEFMHDAARRFALPGWCWRQTIAIALSEAGASKYESKSQNKRHLAQTKRKEAEGETYQQEREGSSHVGASGKRESSRAMGGRNATGLTKRGRKAAASRARKSGGATKAELYNRARKQHIQGRSHMTKRQLENALHWAAGNR
jgi:hypothetical protein